MCYSAQAVQNYQLFLRQHGAKIDFDAFVQLYEERARRGAGQVRIPKAMDANFSETGSSAERHIRQLIAAHARAESERLEQELFKQKKRLADGERSMTSRVTKKAENEVRIAGNKVKWLTGKLSDLKRTELQDRDARIFPHSYAPLLVSEGGRRWVRPMRYLCRLAGKPASYDRRYPGTFNARRDNLEGFWKQQFGHTHGILLATGFYENVSRHHREKRELRPGEEEESVVIEFRPRSPGPMQVACLWSRWTGKGDEPDLMSFAAITDEPPPEVSDAGHDRCIIPLTTESVNLWLEPNSDVQKAYDALDARERPYYEHRLAA